MAVLQGSSGPSITGTSGGSAGNQGLAQTSATVTPAPTPAPVVAPKGFRLQLSQMLQGWQAAIPSDSSLTSSGGPLKQAAVVAQLQAYLTVYTTLDAQTTTLKSTRVQEVSQLAPARQYFTELKEALVAFFGSRSPQLAQFGLKPKQPAKKLTSEQAAVRVAKATATRKLRGTMGKVQKAKIKSGPMQISVTDATPAATATSPVLTGAASSPPPVAPK